LRHRLRLQEKTAATELLRQPGHLFGTMIHQVMHAWYDQADKNRTDAHAFGQLFETHAKKFSPLLSQAYKPLWHEEMRHIQACLWAYIQQEAENSWQPIEGEMTLAPTVLSWLHPTLRFHGQIDRIDQQGQTQRIIDYKTGKFDKKKTDLWEDGQFVQLPMYTALLEATNHTPVAQSEIHHVKPTGVTRAFVLDQAQWQSQRDSFQALMKQLLTHIDQQTFAPDPGPRMQHCTYCDFQVICGRFRQKALESNT
jgi:ATP-dependent helicase/DNAse subunit B